MKILYIVPFVPWEVKVRSFNLIPRLARNNEIYVVCVSDSEPSANQQEWLNRHCKKVVHVRHRTITGFLQCLLALPTKAPLRIAYCRSTSAQASVRQIYEDTQPDLIYVERWRALQFVPKGLPAPLLCDPTDSMTLYNKRLMKAGAWWERVLGWEEYNKFVDYEPELARRVNTCIFCSRLDLACVKGLASNVRYELVPNGVDCERYCFKGPEEEEPGTVVFTGSFRYRPNCLAAEYFLEAIFPTIEKSVPSVRFLAVGNGAVHALRRYKTRARVQAVDFVPDLRPYLAKAAVTVAPLTVGAGVSNKLGEGFAVGTAVVATPLACGDLRVTSGDELFIAEGPKEFASHVITLLNETTMRRQMAIRARRFVESMYSWEIVSSKMEDIMRSTAGLDVQRKNDKAFARA